MKQVELQKLVEKLSVEYFNQPFKHELCHYHLHLAGKGYRHVDADFKQLLKQVGGLRYTPSIERTQEKITRWEYQCQGCLQKVYRKRRFNVAKYVCMNCQNSFELKGQRELQVNP